MLLPRMKRVNLRQLLQSLLLCVVALSAISCTVTDEPKKKKPVPPSDGSSSLPWNRPRSFESNAGMGRMMPQSR
ncbi:hypothetical protein [Roseimicrobium sp. ORNL1]|uniref:hypothetical protein n=1 Tax=Roseimicrobium sp. ORNL1 TaxID=2711231 RepID=UPI0013E206DC|nr:hypothetical protein [Roseimicrobium sp. ORNL1]QIF05117.1 hypothetical protein G5S37_27590 [Roseimicrobium sp. ORNL1]